MDRIKAKELIFSFSADVIASLSLASTYDLKEVAHAIDVFSDQWEGYNEPGDLHLPSEQMAELDRMNEALPASINIDGKDVPLSPFANRILSMTPPQLLAADLRHVLHTHKELVSRLPGRQSWTDPALTILTQVIGALECQVPPVSGWVGVYKGKICMSSLKAYHWESSPMDAEQYDAVIEVTLTPKLAL